MKRRGAVMPLRFFHARPVRVMRGYLRPAMSPFGVRAAFPIAILCMACDALSPDPRRADPGATRGLVTRNAMVVSAHPLATEVGVRILREGGNAVDAAVGVHWALAVVAPWAGNIGGGGFMLIRSRNGMAHSIDFRETAPGAARMDMYLDDRGLPDAALSLDGHLAAGVPGSVAGLFAVHDSLGSLPMERLIQPAIDLAGNGFALTPLEANELNLALPRLRRNDTMPNAYTARDRWRAGDTLRLMDLARSLERIRDAGAAGFYEGATASLLVAEMQRGGGIITADDLREYRPEWRPVVRGGYRGYGIISMGPPSSGGIVLLQCLESMEAMDVGAGGRQRAATVHRMVEAERRAYADRAVHLGDPDFVEVPVDALIDTAYADRRMDDFHADRATPSSLVHAGEPPRGSGHTTHFSVVDARGDAVSCTTTLNGSYGSAVVVGGAGFLLNNEMDDFSAAPGSPNAYGLIGGDANAIAPRKRMLSSMAPTIVTRADGLFMVLGTPGGSTIPTSVFQTVLNVIDHGMGMQEAVEAPRFHHQWLPDTIMEEAGAIAAEDSLRLVRMGHVLKVRAPIGSVDAILVLPDGRLEGGADPRGDDVAGGF